jgi:hypothetical protein
MNLARVFFFALPVIASLNRTQNAVPSDTASLRSVDRSQPGSLHKESMT